MLKQVFNAFIKHIVLTRLGTDSDVADFFTLRACHRPAYARISGTNLYFFTIFAATAEAGASAQLGVRGNGGQLGSATAVGPRHGGGCKI